MTAYVVEVIDSFDEAVPCRDLVYSSVPEDCMVRDTRVYEVEGKGSLKQLGSFVRNVLVDPVSQDWELLDDAGDSAEPGYDHRLDVWFQDDVLDLEEEYLLDYCEANRGNLAFEVETIQLFTRYYLDLKNDGEDVIQAVVRDLANPVIHNWNVETNA